MPIRFRCVYCDKLLGIARRKAGAVVNCPQCGQPLIVPTPDAEPAKVMAGAASQAAPPVPNKLFERDDFDVVLQDGMTVQAAEEPLPRSSRHARKRKESNLRPRPFPVENSLPSPPTPMVAPYTPPPRQRPKGMVLTTGMLIAAIVLVLVLLLAAFGGGLLVGRMLATNANG